MTASILAQLAIPQPAPPTDVIPSVPIEAAPSYSPPGQATLPPTLPSPKKAKVGPKMPPKKGCASADVQEHRPLNAKKLVPRQRLLCQKRLLRLARQSGGARRVMRAAPAARRPARFSRPHPASSSAPTQSALARHPRRRRPPRRHPVHHRLVLHQPVLPLCRLRLSRTLSQTLCLWSWATVCC